VTRLARPTAEQVAALRRRAGLTQAQAAGLVHATNTTWSHWENGHTRMSAVTWELACIKVETLERMTAERHAKRLAELGRPARIQVPGQPAPPPPAIRSCPACGRPVEAAA